MRWERKHSGKVDSMNVHEPWQTHPYFGQLSTEDFGVEKAITFTWCIFVPSSELRSRMRRQQDNGSEFIKPFELQDMQHHCTLSSLSPSTHYPPLLFFHSQSLDIDIIGKDNKTLSSSQSHCSCHLHPY